MKSIQLSMWSSLLLVPFIAVHGQGDQPPTDYVDDVFHCDDPSNMPWEEFSIGCDENTWLWNIEELEESKPPEVCEEQTSLTEEEARNADDWFEPCVLWAITFGNLQPTSEPTGEFRC